MSLESLKLEIEKRKNRSEERYNKYLDKGNLSCTFDKSDMEEVRKETYQEILDMIEKEQGIIQQEDNWEEEEKEEKEWFLNCVKNDENFSTIFGKIIKDNLINAKNTGEDIVDYLIMKIENCSSSKEYNIIEEMVCTFTEDGIGILLKKYHNEVNKRNGRDLKKEIKELLEKEESDINKEINDEEIDIGR